MIFITDPGTGQTLVDSFVILNSYDGIKRYLWFEIMLNVLDL